MAYTISYNQTFKPVFTSRFDSQDYHLMIFNRWGELIFESYNATIGWNATYPVDGELCQDGVSFFPTFSIFLYLCHMEYFIII